MFSKIVLDELIIQKKWPEDVRKIQDNLLWSIRHLSWGFRDVGRNAGNLNTFTHRRTIVLHCFETAVSGWACKDEGCHLRVKYVDDDR